MKCKKCPYFHIVQQPIRTGGGIPWDFGLAMCTKHDLVVDFADNRKLNKLECVEGKDSKP